MPTPRFDAVDGNDPATCIAFLDLAASLADVRRLKAISHEMLRIQDGDHVLDVGCGTGTDAVTLARKVGPLGQVTGVDLSRAMIDVAVARAAPFGLRVSFRQADIHALPFADASFDAVLVDRVLHFLPDPERAMEEVRRVTAPGGRVVISEPDWSTLSVSGGDASLNAAVLRSGGCMTSASRIGARLDRLLEGCGLALVEQRNAQLEVTDYRLAVALFGLEAVAQRAVASGSVKLGDARVWLRSLQHGAERGELRVVLAGSIAHGAVLLQRFGLSRGSSARGPSSSLKRRLEIVRR